MQVRKIPLLFADRNEGNSAAEGCTRCRLSASDLFGTSVWKSGGLLRPTVPAGLRIIKGQIENGDDVDTDELNEELEDLNCAREDYPGGVAGIGPEEIDLIIDLCNGKDIPTDKRLSLLRAIHHIKDTQIERSILKVSMAATAVSANFWMKPNI